MKKSENTFKEYLKSSKIFEHSSLSNIETDILSMGTDRNSIRSKRKQNDRGTFGLPCRSRGHVGIISKKHSRRGNEAKVNFTNFF